MTTKSCGPTVVIVVVGEGRKKRVDSQITLNLNFFFFKAKEMVEKPKANLKKKKNHPQFLLK